MKIKREPHNWIAVTGDDGGTIRCQTVLSNLLYEVLQKLEEIRCGIIDVEDSIETKSDNPAVHSDGADRGRCDHMAEDGHFCTQLGDVVQ